MKTVKVELEQDTASLVANALRYVAKIADDRIASGEAFTDGHDQPSQLRWIATYIEHKLKDAK